MKRRFIITLAVLGACLAPVAAIAAVANSPHDMTQWTGGGATAQLCQACHTPHNAGSDKLWAQTGTGDPTGMSTVQTLCFTCHDGTVTSVGATTAFSTTLESHSVAGADCSGGAQSCHDVHDNTEGQFLTVTLDGPSQTYCVSCHGTTGGALPGGDHTTGSMHYTLGSTFNCNSCHAPHGAVVQNDGNGIYTFGNVTNNKPILLADNFAGDEYGTMCIACHNNQAPFAGVVSDVADYRETAFDGSETKHPTFTTGASGNWNTDMIGCVVCHDVHDSGGTVTGNGEGSFLLSVENTHSASCIGCHDGATAPDVVGGGGGTHFTGDVSATAVPTTANGASLPWGNQLDEDGNPGQDFVGNQANIMMCETCHSVHKNGVSGSGQQAYFLRMANTAQNEICSQCHSTN